jgi:hypothetical protein
MSQDCPAVPRSPFSVQNRGKKPLVNNRNFRGASVVATKAYFSQIHNVHNTQNRILTQIRETTITSQKSVNPDPSATTSIDKSNCGYATDQSQTL